MNKNLSRSGSQNGMYGVHRFGKDSPYYKDGKYSQERINKCQDCGEIISNTSAIRCKPCSYKARKKILPLCIDCNRPLKSKRVKRCRECHLKLMTSQKGELSPSFRGGKAKCEECGKELSGYRQKRCKVHANLGEKNPRYGKKENSHKKAKRIKKIIAANNSGPNKCERLVFNLLNELCFAQYKYTGEGKRIVGGYCPDFLDEHRKYIVEFFGDYWHNLPGYKERDAKKVKNYNKLGYKVLVIWEHELKDTVSLAKNIIEFDRS